MCLTGHAKPISNILMSAAGKFCHSSAAETGEHWQRIESGMVKLSFLGDSETIAALKQDLVADGLLTDVEQVPGTRAEVERLGFNLGDVVTLVGLVGGAIEAISLTRAAIKALRKTGSQKLEITGPTGRATIDVAGKTPEEIEEAVRKALPFLK